MAVAACQHRQSHLDTAHGIAAAVALAASDSHIEDVLLWTVSDKGEPLTHWVRGTSSQFHVLFSRPGVVLPVGNSLVALVESMEPVALEDCLGDTGQKRSRLRTGEAHSLALVDLRTGERREIFLPEAPDEPGIEDFDARAVPIASAGSTVILRIQEDIVRCATERSSRHIEIAAFDVSTGDRVPLFSPVEDEALLATEKTAALALLRGNRTLRVQSPTDLSLRDLEFTLSGQSGLRLTYVFGQGDQEAGEEKIRYRSALSATVPARTVPAFIAVAALVPPVLARLLETVPHLPVQGWAPILAQEEDRPSLLQAFTGKSPSSSPAP
jgi:hypothetical protein